MKRHLKITLFAGLIVALILSPAARNLIDSKFRSSTEINGVVLRTLRVDSEYGTFNFRITHDVYIQNIADAVPHSRYRVAITNSTRFFTRNGNNLQPATIEALKTSDQVRASVIETGDRDNYTMATATDFVILKTK